MLRKILKPKIVVFIGALFLMAFGLWLSIHFHRMTQKFDSHRWNLPSRIYSDSYPLYPGLAVKLEALEEKLSYLGYRLSPVSPQTFGQYHRGPDFIEVYLHSFQYAYESFSGYPLRIEMASGRIQKLTRMDTGESVPLVQFEPELIASIFDDQMEDRTFVPLSEIPDTLKKALVLMEDERFYQHGGIDPVGIARAMFVNLKSFSFRQGGSTLTQQLVKNYFLTSEKKIIRKVNEALLAILLDIFYSKDEILESYFNEIYFAQRGPASVSGVEEASQFYFSKKVSQISLPEIALLAGMIPAPGRFSPFINPIKAYERRSLVLKKLLEEKVITPEQFEEAQKTPLPQKPKYTQKQHLTHFIELVKRQLAEKFSVEVLWSEGFRIFSTLDMTAQRAAEASLKEGVDALEKNNSLLKKKTQEGQALEGALLALQPSTGFVRAYVAGRDFDKMQFDHILDAKRQPGSVFKPFVYLTALNSSKRMGLFTLASLIPDSLLSLKEEGKNWVPQNYDKKYHGLVRLREALENSYNVACVWLAQEVGLDEVIETATLVGLGENLKPYPSLALGAFEVSPWNLLGAYSIFPNQGVKTEPMALRQVVTKDGDILERKNLSLKRLFPEDSIYLMNQILRGVIDRGTAQSAHKRGLNVLAAGKTGTTSDTRDAWFLGYTPELAAVVWIGYDDNSKTGLTGASGALPIWTEFMKKMENNRFYNDFDVPENIVIVPVDKKTGLLANEKCGQPFDEFFIEGTEPTQSCLGLGEDKNKNRKKESR